MSVGLRNSHTSRRISTVDGDLFVPSTWGIGDRVITPAEITAIHTGKIPKVKSLFQKIIEVLKK